MILSTVAMEESSTTTSRVKGKPQAVLRTLDAARLPCSLFGVGDRAGWVLMDYESGFYWYEFQQHFEFHICENGKFTKNKVKINYGTLRETGCHLTAGIWVSLDKHRHTGIGLLTPEVVHYGLAEEVIQRRNDVLAQAYRAHPERFVKAIPTAPQLPEAVWINKPEKSNDDSEGIIL